MYGLLGEKLGHSFSPQIHSMLGGYEYRLFEIPPEKLGEFMTKRKFEGINVTIPYKKAVMPFLDEISREAQKIGSVNTVVRRGEKLIGYNTDYFGFLYMVKKCKADIQGKKAVVLGSGGASLTVKAVLGDLGASQIVTVSRSGEDNYENISRHYDAQIVVNATPVGMYPGNLQSAVDIRRFEKAQCVLDIVYNPLKTKLALDAEKSGIRALCGLSMLVAQAKAANEIFFGRELPDEICEKIENRLVSKMRNIVLVGMAGCGKTTVGKELAEKTGKRFADTDETVKNDTGSTPEQLITEKGEAYFRLRETEAVKKVGKEKSSVIATGGGVVTVEENLFPLRQNGIIVFINRSAEKLTDSGRPISQKEGIKSLYEKRMPLYRRFADIEVNGNGSVTQTAQNILKEIEKYENTCNQRA